MKALVAPFPWFGGKRRVADEVWARLGNVANFIEPFFGSGAVLLGRPHPPGVETVCDADHYLCNLWRAIQADPDGVAHWADWPVNECDLAVRHAWLVTDGRARIATCDTDAAHYDVQVAGWWLWGACCWIGVGWCSGAGPWSIVDAQWVKAGGAGVNRKMPAVGNAGRGVNRQMPQTIGEGSMGIHRKNVDILKWLQDISIRLRHVRVVCGDWSRVTGDSVLRGNGMTGVFLDPPYGVDDRVGVYTHDCRNVATQAAEWAREIGKRSDTRVAFCGYDTEHVFDGWTAWAWKANGGYGSQSDGQGRANAGRETIWFSPACLAAREPSLFDQVAA